MEAETKKHIVWEEDNTYQWDQTFAGMPTGMINWSRMVYLYTDVLMAIRVKFYG